MLKKILLFTFLLTSVGSFSQTKFENLSREYSFSVPKEYEKQSSNHSRNEFVFVDKDDTTSLVVNVNLKEFDTKGMLDFKKATNAAIETNYFRALESPQIMKRGDLLTYQPRTIFFHVRHKVSHPAENDYMLTYLFYHKGKEINFIFRTKERRLDKVLPTIETIVNSVILID